MFDLKKLNDIDIKDIERSLKNIDMKTLQDDLMKRKDIVLNIVFILVTFFGAQFLWNNTQQSLSQMKQQLTQLEEKNEIILMLEEENQKIKNFIENFPQGFPSFTAVIDRVSILADEANTTIISFSPRTPVENDLFATYQVEFSMTAPHYDNITQLLKKIEQSKENMRIDSWSASPEQQRGQEDFQKIIYKIIISSIQLNNDK
jgi:hypothetical protein